jgi:hypothetical protein
MHATDAQHYLLPQPISNLGHKAIANRRSTPSGHTPLGVAATIIRVQHVLPIQLNIHPNDILYPGPNKESQASGKKRDHQHLSV